MKTFGELLNQHMRRVGISDAEMARTLGVQRQTIFRWREGLVQHPRTREDVLRMASKLRLTPVERDELLLAAGFPPQEPVLDSSSSIVHLPEETAPQPVPEMVELVLGRVEPRPMLLTATRQRRSRLWPIVGAVFVVLLLVGVVAVALSRSERFSRQDMPSPAGPDEMLILLCQFANYSQGQAGYNVAGRLSEALQEEVKAAALNDVRIATWPAVVDNPEAAMAAAQAVGATLVVWGEYDSGRVVARVQAPRVTGTVDQRELHRLLSTPSDLNITVNIELPREMRWMVLYVLGEAALSAHRHDVSQAALQRALSLIGGDDTTTGRIYYSLGLIETSRAVPDWSQAIAYYTLALEYNPGFVSALNNRGLSYFNRRAEGDLLRAAEDFAQAANLDPDFAPSQFNLGLALLAQGTEQQERAISALQRAQALAPETPGPYNALCWAYALQNQPAEALPYCNQAVALDSTPMSRDSRGVVYALLGRYDEAIIEFESFLSWLKNQRPALYDRYAPRRQAWIAALRQGRNPFDQTTLEALRNE